VEGQVTAGQAATTVFTSGVSVVAGAVGAPAIVGIGLSVGAGLIAQKIKDDFNAYDREVTKPYIEFAKGKVRQAGNVTSQEIAQAYQERKTKLAYCSKCNERDKQFGCPGMQGFVHGYNPDLFASTGANEVFVNPWVKAAYEQHRSRHPSGEMPFRGVMDVSPVSEAPPAAR
jgi:hypothetical protein